MFGSSVLELAIGLVVLYFVMSTLSSAITELIMIAIGRRAALLRGCITKLFSDSNGVPGWDILNHGIINTRVGSAKDRDHIAAESFSAVVVWYLQTAAGNKPTAAAPTVDSLRAAIGDMPQFPAKQALEAIFQRAGDDVNKAVMGIEDWYNHVMDDLASKFKRQVQGVLLISGLVAAILLNADTIMIAGTLSTSPQLRAAVSNSTSALIADAKRRPESAPANAAPGGDYAGATVTTEPNGQSSRADDPVKKAMSEWQAALSRLVATEQMLKDTSLPLGWSNQPADVRALPWLTPPGVDDSWAKCIVRCVTKLAGLFATAIAATFGAPFWFDVLNTFVSYVSGKNKPTMASNVSQKADGQP